MGRRGPRIPLAAWVPLPLVLLGVLELLDELLAELGLDGGGKLVVLALSYPSVVLPKEAAESVLVDPGGLCEGGCGERLLSLGGLVGVGGDLL
jgi:hypothetical protein